MRVIVVGGGLVGSTLAAKLSGDGHDVVLVEQSRELIADLNEHLDVQTICGNGATIPVLVKAGIENADLLLATTDSDEANMVVGLVAAFALSRFMGALLFEVNPNDAVTFASVAGVLLLVSLAATWIPAARAAGTDPVRALGKG